MYRLSLIGSVAPSSTSAEDYPNKMDTHSRHLLAAARHYATTSPALSAHLFMQIDANKQQSLQGSVRHCLACGTLWIPGRTSREVTVSRKTQKKPTTSSAPRNSSTTSNPRKKTEPPMGSQNGPELGPKTHLVEECLVCWQKTTTEIPKQLRRSQDKTRQSKMSQELSATTIPAVGSRNRAQRKKKNQLSALLKRSKEMEAKPISLNLADLMETS